MATAAPDVLRVSVVGGRQRVDLVVPAAVRVAELLPELVRRLGEEDPADAGTARLAAVGGAPLSGAAGLAEQGIPDGAVLVLTADQDHAGAVEDDLTTLVGQAVRTVPRPGSGTALRCGLGIAGTALAAAAIGAFLLRTPAAAATAGGVSVLLLAGALRARHRPGPGPLPVAAAAAATAASWLAVALAAAAGAIAGVVGAGAALALAGTAAALATRGRAPTLWAAPAAGTVLVLAGLVVGLTGLDPAAVFASALVLVVVAGDLLPWCVAGLTGLLPPPLAEEPPCDHDPDAVLRGVRRAHAALLVATVATGLLLAVLGPFVAGRGPAGLVLALLCCAVVALRTRRQHVGAGGLAGLLAGAAPLLPVVAALWLARPDWRLGVVLGAAGFGLLVLVLLATPVHRTARAGRLAELAEALALVALPPVLLTATGLLDVVRRAVG